MITLKTVPWLKGARRYAGWIPNVRSHLSFSMIGAAQGAATLTLPFKSRPTRAVVVLQRRDINDYPWPNRLSRLLHPDIVVNWLLDAETSPVRLPVVKDGEITSEYDRQGMLRGRIYFLPRQETRSERKLQRAALEGIGNVAADCRQAYLAGGPEAEQPLLALSSTIRSEAEASGLHVTIELALLRTGECRLWYDVAPEDMTDADLDLIAQQAYYFIKDVVHSHTHHDPSSDQITPLTVDEPSPHEPEHSHEVAWRRETLWSLSREVERLNREGGLANQRRSLGIIAYAEAFQAALMTHVRDPDACIGFSRSTVVHDYDFKHLKDSIRADIDVNATKLAQSLQVSIAFVATTISITALVSSVVSTHNGGLARRSGAVPDGTIDVGVLGGALPYLAWNPVVTGVLLTALLLVFMAMFVFDKRAGILNGPQRVLSQFARAFAGSVSDKPVRQFYVDLGLHLALLLGSMGLVGLCLWGAFL